MSPLCIFLMFCFHYWRRRDPPGRLRGPHYFSSFFKKCIVRGMSLGSGFSLCWRPFGPTARGGFSGVSEVVFRVFIRGLPLRADLGPIWGEFLCGSKSRFHSEITIKSCKTDVKTQKMRNHQTHSFAKKFAKNVVQQGFLHECFWNPCRRK